MKTHREGLFLIVLLSLAAFQAGGCSDDSSVVTLQKVDDLYYKVDMNLQAASRYDLGREYALAIKNGAPDFESRVDSGLKATVEQMRHHVFYMNFGIIIRRAQTIFANVPSEYQEEIRGMQSVFSSTDDTLGNGELSQNKLLVYELAPDVARLVSCSASAAFGEGTENGRTILGRNLEWHDHVLQDMAALQTVATLHNGNKSTVLFGFLGQMNVISGLNAANVFASILDSDIGWLYMLSENERSYAMDLRYALENETSIQGIASALSGKDYAYDFNVFMADTTSSAVLEVDIHTPFSGLRTATSALKTNTKVPILPWNFSNAIACVNWFTLPGTEDNSAWWVGNAARWSTFIKLYGEFLSQGKVTMDGMKLISGYPGPKDNGRAEDGAIWRYEDLESEVQSIIMDMGTLETWISFQPTGQPALRSPNYIRIFSGNPF